MKPGLSQLTTENEDQFLSLIYYQLQLIGIKYNCFSLSLAADGDWLQHSEGLKIKNYVFFKLFVLPVTLCSAELFFHTVLG